MKKKVLLILTVIISMVLCIDRAEANTFPELTCIYDKTDSQPGIKFIQTNDGNARLFIAPSNANDISSNTNWVKINSKSRTGKSVYITPKTFTKCPKCVKYTTQGGGKIDFDCGDTDGQLKEEFNNLDEQYAYAIVDVKSDTIIHEKPQSDNEVLNDEWEVKCAYTNGANIIEVFLTENEYKMYDNNIEVNSSFETSKLKLKISFTELMNKNKDYTGKNRCIKNIYKKDMIKCTSTSCINKNKKDFSITYQTKYDKNFNNYALNLDKSISKNQNNNNTKIDNDNINFKNCEDLIGKDAKDLINTVMKWIRITVPLLLIVFGILDFSKAVFSSNEDGMKKTREKFIKRIVAAVLVFLAPILVNLILDLGNQVWEIINADTCLK